MKTSFWRRWCQSLLNAKPSRPVSRLRPRRQPLVLETLEDRVTPSLTPQMVLDINSGAASSEPSQMVAIGSTTYFTADDGVHGVGLWESDGTGAGTVLVSSFGWSPTNSPNNLTNVNGTLFFSAHDYEHGEELWKSDGTAAGTTLVKDINPGWGTSWYYGFYNFPFGSDPSNLTNVNGTLFFTADDGTNGRELWKSDSTEAGTVKLSSSFSSASDLTNVNGTLFFTANNGTNGQELWKSDGTAAGTLMVEDINPGSVSSNPSSLTNVNGTLFFLAHDGLTNGWALWKSDGTEAGTVKLSLSFSSASDLTNVNGTLFFTANNGTNGQELWKSDGTAAGTVLVKDTAVGFLTNVNGTLFFSARDGTTGQELWKSDGTAAGTALVKDINPGTSGSYPFHLTNVNGTLFFSASDDGNVSSKLWQSDGTEAGTVPVANFFASALTDVGGTLFFAADDGVHGAELWKLVDDGQTQATSLKVSGFPATVTAGAAGTFTVTVKNADGTTNTDYRDTVHFTSSDPQAVLPADYTFTEADQGVHTFSATLKTAGSQSMTVSPTVVPGGAGTQAGITVTPAAASRFTIAGFPSPATAGAAGSFTVTATDAYGNRVTGYRGTVRFTSSDAQAVLPGSYTFTAADAGTHTFTATLKKAGYQSLTATDIANAGITGTQSVTVNPAAASRLVLIAPASVNAGAQFSLTVKVVDAYGNVVTGYRGTLSFSTSDVPAGLPKKYSFTAADQGVHTFTGLVLKKRGKQTITVTDTLNSSLTAGVSIDVL
jgi:ELWxxDGT repeat protein